jgi:hypothetical protein
LPNVNANALGAAAAVVVVVVVDDDADANAAIILASTTPSGVAVAVVRSDTLEVDVFDVTALVGVLGIVGSGMRCGGVTGESRRASGTIVSCTGTSGADTGTDGSGAGGGTAVPAVTAPTSLLLLLLLTTARGTGILDRGGRGGASTLAASVRSLEGVRSGAGVRST